MGTRVTLDEVYGVGDILDTIGYRIDFGNVPNAGSAKALTVACHNLSIPGFGNQTFQAFMMGQFFATSFTTSTSSENVTSLRLGSEFAHKMTLVWRLRSSRTKGKTPRTMSTPELSQKNAAH